MFERDRRMMDVELLCSECSLHLLSCSRLEQVDQGRNMQLRCSICRAMMMRCNKAVRGDGCDEGKDHVTNRWTRKTIVS